MQLSVCVLQPKNLCAATKGPACCNQRTFVLQPKNLRAAAKTKDPTCHGQDPCGQINHLFFKRRLLFKPANGYSSLLQEPGEVLEWGVPILTLVEFPHPSASKLDSLRLSSQRLTSLLREVGSTKGSWWHLLIVYLGPGFVPSASYAWSVD